MLCLLLLFVIPTSPCRAPLTACSNCMSLVHNRLDQELEALSLVWNGGKSGEG